MVELHLRKHGNDFRGIESVFPTRLIYEVGVFQEEDTNAEVQARADANDIIVMVTVVCMISQ